MLSLLAVVLVSLLTDGRRETECFETLVRAWSRPRGTVRQPHAAKAEGESHD